MVRSDQIQDAGQMANLTPTATTLTLVQSANPQVSSPSLAAILNAPGSGRLRRRLFEVTVSGTLVCAADCTANFSIQSGTSMTPGNNTTIASSGAIAVTAAIGACSYTGTLRLIYNTVSGRLEGTQSWMVNNTLVAQAALTAVVAGLSDANEPVFSLVHGVALSVNNANTYLIPDTFALGA